MKLFRGHWSKNQIQVLLLYLFIASFFYSRFLISVSIVCLLLTCLFNFTSEPKIKLEINRAFFKNFEESLRNLPLILFYTIFFLTLISYFNSTNKDLWLNFVRLKLPYLAIPFIFINLKHLSKRQYFNLYYFLIQISFLSAVWVLVNYFSSYEEITDSIGKGQAIPTPINHTKYSVIIAISILAGIFLRKESHFFYSKKERHVLSAQLIFLVVFIHILSVRSGLAALYTSSLIMGSMFFLTQKKYLQLGAFLVLLFTLPIIAYFKVPSFHKKIHYTLYDLQMNKKGKGDHYNDSMRLRSWKAGLEMFRKHPFTGVGIGDIEDENRRIHELHYNLNSRPRLPHNQFLFYASAFGLPGLLIFTLSFFAPLFYRKNFREPLYLSMMLCLLVLCMVEKPLERSNFIAFYLVFSLMAMSYLKNWKREDSGEIQ